MEEFASLFAPGMRHEQKERERLALWRDDVGDADPPSTVDLDRGIAVIRLPKKKEPAATADNADGTVGESGPIGE
jgi:Family of unknown function (DUF6191)